MPPRARPALALLGLLALAAAAEGQVVPVTDRPTLLVPARGLTRHEKDRREARKLFGLAMLRQRQDQLLEATRALEEAVRLDPDAAVLHRALVPLYLALSRTEDALAACTRTLELDPGDYETWYLKAQQLRAQGQAREARAALTRAAGCAGLGERPELRIQVYFDQGVLSEETQDFEAAIKAYEEVIQILEKPEALLEAGPFSAAQLSEQAANTHERVIKICIQARQFDRALRAYARASKKYPVLARRLDYNLAQVCVAQGKPGEALRHLDEYLQTQPQGTEAYELKIKLLAEVGRAREIVPALEEYARGDAQNNTLKLLLAREYGRAGRVAQGERLYMALAQETPTPDIYRGLFTLYRDNNRMADALALLDGFVVRVSKKSDKRAEGEAATQEQAGAAAAAAHARAMLAVLREDAVQVKALLAVVRSQPERLRTLDYETRRFLAVLADRTHQLQDAEALYRSCLHNGPADDPQAEGVIYDGLLQVLMQGRKYEAVVELCREGLERTKATNRVVFHDELSRALIALGKSDEAIAEANKAVELGLNDIKIALYTRRNRVLILAQAERISEAIADCQALLKEFPGPEDVRQIRHLLSTVYNMAHDLPHAEEQLQLILQADANDPGANNDLGYYWAEQGKNLEEAERMIRKAIEQDRQQKNTSRALTTEADRDNAAYLDSLGWVLFRRGQTAEAQEWLEKAAALPEGAGDPTVWDHLGDVYYRLKAWPKARKAWQKSVELFETEKRRKADERYQEVKHKLELLKADSGRR
jgi:tetratricopeptide (TPR) repeat protein